MFLALIGPIWLNVKPDNDPNGLRGLDHPGDCVRQEIATALRKGHVLPVIPVLVRGVSMPTAEELPEELKDLAYRNSLNMNNLDWDGDMAKLVDAMRAHVGEPRSGDAVATVPAPKSVAPSAPPASSRHRKWILLGIAAIALIAFLILYSATKGSTGGTTGAAVNDTEYSVALVKNPLGSPASRALSTWKSTTTGRSSSLRGATAARRRIFVLPPANTASSSPTRTRTPSTREPSA